MGHDRDLRPLAVPVALVTALSAANVIPVWPGSAHLVALPPLDLFADVRVLLAEAPSYPAFLAGLVLVIGVRAAVLAAMLRALHGPGLLRAVRFYVFALPVALVAGGLAFAGVAAVYATFLWIGVAVTLVTALVVAPRPWRDGGTPPGALQTLAYLAALLVVSLVSSLGGTGVRLLMVWVSGALTAATIHWLGRGVTPSRSRPAPAIGVPVALVALVALVAAAVTPAAAPARAEPRTEGSLFLVPGIGGSSGTSTMFHLDPVALGYGCDATAYFSYAGPGTGAPQRDARCPIRSGAPYRAQDTRRPLAELLPSFRAQYAELAEPVVVVAHSQGGWVAAAALAHADVSPPAALVVLGSFPGHDAAYRLGGGAGAVGTDLLEALTALLRRVDATSFDPRAPLARELLGTPGAVADTMREAVAAGVPVITVTSAFDLPIMAGDRALHGAVELCPFAVHHGDLPRSPRVLREIRRALESPVESDCGWWPRRPLQAFSAFAVPTG